MSYAVDAASKLHEKQLAAATKGQELFVTVVEKVGDLRGKAPKAPASVTDQLDKLVAPITKIVGTRSEVTEYVTRTAREWLALQQQYQARVLDIVGRQQRGDVEVANTKPASAPAVGKPTSRAATRKTAASKTAPSKTAASA
ncbi:MAG: hypothetical protein ABWZ26_00575 [Candidatus Nanopelagicales bacterium]